MNHRGGVLVVGERLVKYAVRPSGVKAMLVSSSTVEMTPGAKSSGAAARRISAVSFPTALRLASGRDPAGGHRGQAHQLRAPAHAHLAEEPAELVANRER